MRLTATASTMKIAEFTIAKRSRSAAHMMSAVAESGTAFITSRSRRSIAM